MHFTEQTLSTAFFFKLKSFSPLAAAGCDIQLSHMKNHFAYFLKWGLTVWWQDGMILMAAYTSAGKNHYFIHEPLLKNSQDPLVVVTEASVYGAVFIGL